VESASQGKPEAAPGSASGVQTAARRAEPIHDFAQKLRQPKLWPAVVDYVRWQQALRKARADGMPDPATPALVPLSINLDLTTACNYACDHCIDWEILNSKQKHEDEQLRTSLRNLAAGGMRSVILIGGGEPTLYPGFVPMVQFLKELGLQVAVVSNGSRNEQILKAAPYFTEGDWVRLSLDSGTNATFRRMHHPSSKTLSLEEICSWVSKIKAVNASFQFGFSFVITWRGGARDDVKVVENIGEIEQAAALAERSGFDYISFKPFLERARDGAEVLDPAHAEAGLREIVARIRASIDRAKQLESARPGFRVLESTNLRVLMAGNWKDYTSQPRTCHMQALRQVVTPLGTFNCPAHRGVPKAMLGGKDLWNDHAAGASATKQTLDRFDSSHECSEVTCLYHGTNWWLEELIASTKPVDELEAGPERADAFL
jgi:sulfatase maturation enzyme AslB (radical SAM superfamily)